MDNIDSNLLLSLLPVADLSATNFAYIDSDFSLSPLGSFADSALVDDATLAQQQVIALAYCGKRGLTVAGLSVVRRQCSRAGINWAGVLFCTQRSVVKVACSSGMFSCFC